MVDNITNHNNINTSSVKSQNSDDDENLGLCMKTDIMKS